MGSLFHQEGPTLRNQYTDDRLLRSYLAWRLSPEMLAEIEPGLQSLGARAAEEILELGERAERNPPVHVPFDAWGRRIDEVRVDPAWRHLHRIAAEERLISPGYARAHGAFSRIHQFARIYLYAPSAAIYGCPIAMTDGAARLLEVYGDERQRRDVFPHLISDSPEELWTSGQWMTERTGGSDVSATSTIARPVDGGFALHGDKWFTSAVSADIAMTLARIEGAPPGSEGLSVFLVRLRDECGRLQGIEINRLKEKLGTRALPTAELSLEGARAELVGPPGGGVKKISLLFNITRIHNAVGSAGALRRGLALALDYSKKRQAFGRPLLAHDLHADTLASLQVELHAAFLLAFRAAELLGEHEVGASDGRLLRLLTPLAKLYTAKQAVAGSAEVLEAFGGAGYVEDTGLPVLLRNALVLPIWEGTTNILSLDVLRAIEKDRAWDAFVDNVARRLASVREPVLEGSRQRIERALGESRALLEALARDPTGSRVEARRFAYGLARIYAGSLLLEHAQFSASRGDRAPEIIARRWCAQALVSEPRSFADVGVENQLLLIGSNGGS